PGLQCRAGGVRHALKKELRSWANATKKQLLFKLHSLNLRDRMRIDDAEELKKSLRSGVRFSRGSVNTVYFSFARHGIFLEHGVGKQRPVGSLEAKRNAKKWLSEVLPDQFNRLEDIIEERYADIIEDEVRLLIPGVIELTTKPLPESVDWVDEDGKVIKIIIDKSFF
ncbi:MAG: hypothetical protein AAF242_06240, partial [Bacteroidota bacterium]